MVTKDGAPVGHLPKKLSRIYSQFIRKGGRWYDFFSCGREEKVSSLLTARQIGDTMCVSVGGGVQRIGGAERISRRLSYKPGTTLLPRCYKLLTATLF